MSTIITVHSYTGTYPDPQESESLGSQAGLQIVRGVTNAKRWTYATASDKVNLQVSMRLTRAKDEELRELVRVYHTTTWRITFEHDGSVWDVQLIGDPIRRVTDGRQDENNPRTGNESVTVRLQFSAEKVL